MALASFFVVVQASVGATYYVATNGNDAADGTSWATAKQTIQAAIDLTVSNDTVLVSNGVYATGGRVVFGAMTNRVAITNAITVSSVNGPDFTIIQGAGPVGNAAVRCVYLGSNATISGFTLTNGATRTTSGDAVAEQSGGGVWCAASAVVSNCTLTGNFAGRFGFGGGSYGGTLNNCSLIGNTASGSGSGGGSSGGTLNNCILTGNSARIGGGAHQATLNNCTLTSNVASQGGGSYGGTLNNSVLAGNSGSFQGGGSYLGTLNNCTLTGNSSANSGGGSYLGTLNNCTLRGNSANIEGGGSYDGTLNNCALVGNSASGRGGGSYLGTLNNCTLTGNSTFSSGGGAAASRLNNCMVTGNSAALDGGGSLGGILKNCTVVGNAANSSGGGLYGGILNNCIVWSNSAPTNANYLFDLVSISNSCTTPMPTNGTGNITNDPQFVSLSTTNLQLSETSPCINTGDNANAPTNSPFDLAGNPRIINGTLDMGAYEFQPYWLWAAAITNGLTNYNDSSTGDGYPNLLKYVTGSSPTNADGLAAFDYLPLVVGQEVVTYEEIYVETNDIVGGIALLFNRNTNATDASLFVETANATTNGTPWTPIAANILGSWGGNTNVTETGTGTPVSVRVADPSDATNKFFRLRATLP